MKRVATWVPTDRGPFPTWELTRPGKAAEPFRLTVSLIDGEFILAREFIDRRSDRYLLAFKTWEAANQRGRRLAAETSRRLSAGDQPCEAEGVDVFRILTQLGRPRFVEVEA